MQITNPDKADNVRILRNRFLTPPLDISAAMHADILFVKNKADGENDLATYCQRENIKHINFNTFATALPIVQAIVSGEKSIDDFAEKGSSG